jgi:hypothetical protein
MLFAGHALASGPQADFSAGKRLAKVKKGKIGLKVDRAGRQQIY